MGRGGGFSYDEGRRRGTKSKTTSNCFEVVLTWGTLVLLAILKRGGGGVKMLPTF